MHDLPFYWQTPRVAGDPFEFDLAVEGLWRKKKRFKQRAA